MKPLTADERKARPVYSGVLRYFPLALLEIARVSYVGSQQHHTGPMRWDRSKSPDEADALVRHLLQAGELDTDGLRHSAKMAWRALALLEKELEAESGASGAQEMAPARTLNARVAHDERHGLAEPCTNGCGVRTYPPGRCVGCRRKTRR